MKIGIDARLITQTGVGIYTRNLLEHLARVSPKDWELVVFVRTSDRSRIDLPQRYHLVHADYRWHTISEQIGFLNLLNAQNLDLMHFTYFSYPLLYRKPFVSTIHDLTPVLFKTGKASTKSPVEYYPKYFAMKHVISTGVRNSRSVIVPSRAVRDQIIAHYHVAGEKIFVTPEGIDARLTTAKENRALGGRYDWRYLLYVGNFYPHKNIHRLLDAFAQLDTEYRLILAGPNDYFAQSVRSYVKTSDLGERVIMHPDPTIEDLVFLYKHARALVHPSLSEGYGLTPIESLYFGTPVIASDIPVFRETMGSGFTPFDPTSVEQIRTVLQHVVTSPKKSAQSVVGKDAFRTMAQQTVAAYRFSVGI